MIDFKQCSLFPDSFKLFTEKRWEKLVHISFSKCSFIQKKQKSMINVLNFCRNVS